MVTKEEFILNKQFTRRLSLLMTLIMALGMLPVFAATAPSTDLQGHWAGSVVSDWMNKGMISGYPDGSFRPEASMTRAEFMVIVNKAYNFTSEKDINFSDVKSSDWYYSIVKKASAAGYISGYPNGTMAPNMPIQRQEVASIFSKLEHLSEDPATANTFKDVPAGWAKGYIGAVVKAGFFSGYGDGLFKPTANIKRGEAVVATDNLVNGSATSYSKAGTYGPATGMDIVSGNVVVSAEGVVLQNMTIKGNLTIDETVGQGTVTLNNVTVEGQTFIKGGGANSIKMTNGSYGKVLMMKVSNEPIRLLAKGVKDLVVEVASISEGGQVVFEGDFKSILISAANMKISTQGVTTIGTLILNSFATNCIINLSSETIIQLMQISAVTSVTGTGRIILAEVSVVGVTFQTAPGNISNTITEIPATNPGTGSGGSNGGGSGGSNNTTPVALAPTANKAAGYLASGSAVTLATGTPSATICYTKDGSTPTNASSVYTTPIIVTGSSVTIKAIAVAGNYSNSSVFSATYYTQPSIADVSVSSGSAVVLFNFYGDNAKTAAIPYSSVLSDPNINLDLSQSTVKLALVSGSAVVTSSSAVTMASMGINVTSGSLTFPTSTAMNTMFGDMSGWSDTANRVILHLVFSGSGIATMDIAVDLKANEVNIIKNLPVVIN